MSTINLNELDKAASGKGNGNPADVLLTLLDNLGFTDNYMECMVPLNIHHDGKCSLGMASFLLRTDFFSL